MLQNPKKITIFAGHNGSGKTSLTVNFALHLRALGKSPVIACDLDTVKPYFRAKDAQATLEAAGVRFIAPRLANSNLDLPTVPPEVRAVFDTPGAWSVLDIGGDDAGALALGQFAEAVAAREHDLFLVVNQRRALTREPAEALAALREIEAACSLRFTGIVNNPNLGPETDAALVEGSAGFARELSRLCGLPVAATAYRRDLPVDPARLPGEAWPIRIYRKEEWAIYD